MIESRVAVIGGGVAGLNVARLLHDVDVDVAVFEARDRLGGRVLTVDETGALADDGFDLGPSWFWPRMQPDLGALVDELRLDTYPQSTRGDVVFERMSRERPQRYVPRSPDTDSIRFVGGSSALVRALCAGLPAASVHGGQRVVGLALEDDAVRLTLVGADGTEQVMRAEQVVASLPPRLLQATVTFSPELPSDVVEGWRSTPTWMAPHAKFFAVYDEPFWLADGLSGTAQSMVGPMLEMHDATTCSGRPALFGFLGVGAVERQAIGLDGLTQACVEQFVRLFGVKAEAPVATLYKDWAADPLTATPDDINSTGHANPSTSWVQGPWSDRLLLAGSETSQREAGYLAGAIHASSAAASRVRQRLMA